MREDLVLVCLWRLSHAADGKPFFQVRKNSIDLEPENLANCIAVEKLLIDKKRMQIKFKLWHKWNHRTRKSLKRNFQKLVKEKLFLAESSQHTKFREKKKKNFWPEKFFFDNSKVTSPTWRWQIFWSVPHLLFYVARSPKQPAKFSIDLLQLPDSWKNWFLKRSLPLSFVRLVLNWSSVKFSLIAVRGMKFNVP